MAFVKRDFDPDDPYDQKVAEMSKQVFDLLDMNVDEDIRADLTINVGMALILGGIMDKPVEERMPTFTSVAGILRDAVKDHGYN